MFKMRYVTESDKPFWFALDKHLSESEFELKVRDERGYIIFDGETPMGIMRYNLFWDNTPFLTLIELDESYQRKGFGRQAMLQWENEMRALDYEMVMTSTRIDEEAKHFYKNLGYVEKGVIHFDNTPCEQPDELVLIKVF